MSITFLPSRLLKGLLVLIIIYAEVRTYRWWSGVQPVSGTMPAWLATSVKGGGTFKRERVLVATSFGAHDDVFMSLVGTLETLLPAEAVRVYSRGLRYGLGTQVLSELGIYASPTSVYYETEEAFVDVDAAWEGKGADVVVLGTCEIDMEFFSDRLWKLWEQRPEDNKFALVCMVHNAGDFNWAEKYSGDWARVGALRVMPISPSVSAAQFNNFMAYSDTPTRYHLGYPHIPIHAHIPILPLEKLTSFNAHGVHAGEYVFSADGDGMGERRATGPKKAEVIVNVGVMAEGGAGQEEFWGVEETEVVVLGAGGGGGETEGGAEGERVRSWGRRDGRVLRDAVIQGNFETARRNYLAIFADLEAEIALNPSMWGYLPPSSQTSPFVPLPKSKDHFVLHLAGNGNPDFISARLVDHVVKVHKGLSYLDFFSLMGSMDVVLPAFTEEGGYYDRQASSTVAMSQQCEVPLLVTPRILRAYSYLSPLTTITRPASLSEISALGHLRAHSLLTSTIPPSRSRAHFAAQPQRPLGHSGAASFRSPARGYDHGAERSYSEEGLKGMVVSEGETREEHLGVGLEVEEMLGKGWIRGEKGWREFKKGVREGNEGVVRRMVLGR